MGGFLIPNSLYFLTGGQGRERVPAEQGCHGRVRAVANQVQQVVALGNNANMHCQAAYYKGSAKEFIYLWSENDPLRAIPFEPCQHLMDPQGQSVQRSRTGRAKRAVMSVSSNGSTDGTGHSVASYASSGDAEHTVTLAF